MRGDSFAIHGDVCWARTPDELVCLPGGYLVCEGGVSRGAFPELPGAYEGVEVRERAGLLVIPGLVDAHLHAPQYAFRGVGMDLELLDWLNQRTFPEEARYADLGYAARAYRIFAEDLRASATTRAVVFATLHVEATELLMDELEATGLVTMVGKVNMDRNSPDDLCEGSAAASLAATERWLDDVAARGYERTTPILTPRFTPSCTDELLAGLGRLRAERGLPVQSHLDENLSEVDWVAELCPGASSYADTYARAGLLAGDAPVVMAHCNYCTDEELAVLRDEGVTVAHCPQSNAQLSSGIAPVRRYLDAGVRVALGTDVAGGATLSMLRAASDAVAASKLRWRLVDQGLAPLTTTEALYLACAGGGALFGRVGSFDEGYELDALVVDDAALRSPRPLTVGERVERLVHLSGDGGAILEKYVAGREVLASAAA